MEAVSNGEFRGCRRINEHLETNVKVERFRNEEEIREVCIYTSYIFFEAELSQFAEGLDRKDKGREGFKNGQEKSCLALAELLPAVSDGTSGRVWERLHQVRTCLQPHREGRLHGDGRPWRLRTWWSVQ